MVKQSLDREDMGLVKMNSEFVLTADERLRIVQESTLFSGLPDVHLETAVAGLRPRVLAVGQCLFFKGDIGDSAYIVLMGCVKIITQTVTGREVVLNTVYPGEYFGELALLDGARRVASAIAGVTSHLAVIDRAEFSALMARSPEFSAAILCNLAARFRKVSDMLEARHLQSLRQRLAQALLTLSEQEAVSLSGEDDIVLTVSQSELADLVGASRVSVNKHLQRWRANGTLTTLRGKIALHDRQGLLPALRDRQIRPF